jgi:hypothetical protein
MSASAAPVPAPGVRMSAWTALWALFGGAVMGLLASSLVFDPIQHSLGLDAAAQRSLSVWQPFPPVGVPARIADLTTFAAVILFCGLAGRRISRTPEAELPVPAVTAAVAGIALLGQETRSWWCLLAVIPAAAALRLAARTPAPRATWRRRAALATAGIAIYAAATGLALADLQGHPLAAAADGTCGVGRARSGRVTDVCLQVVNMARDRTAIVLGVAASSRRTPFRLRLGERSIRPRQELELDVGYRTSCAGVPAGTYTLRQISLRVRAGGDSSTSTIATPIPLTARCG